MHIYSHTLKKIQRWTKQVKPYLFWSCIMIMKSDCNEINVCMTLCAQAQLIGRKFLSVKGWNCLMYAELMKCSLGRPCMSIKARTRIRLAQWICQKWDQDSKSKKKKEKMPQRSNDKGPRLIYCPPQKTSWSNKYRIGTGKPSLLLLDIKNMQPLLFFL